MSLTAPTFNYMSINKLLGKKNHHVPLMPVRLVDQEFCFPCLLSVSTAPSVCSADPKGKIAISFAQLKKPSTKR